MLQRLLNFLLLLVFVSAQDEYVFNASPNPGCVSPGCVEPYENVVVPGTTLIKSVVYESYPAQPPGFPAATGAPFTLTHGVATATWTQQRPTSIHVPGPPAPPQWGQPSSEWGVAYVTQAMQREPGLMVTKIEPTLTLTPVGAIPDANPGHRTVTTTYTARETHVATKTVVRIEPSISIATEYDTQIEYVYTTATHTQTQYAVETETVISTTTACGPHCYTQRPDAPSRTCKPNVIKDWSVGTLTRGSDNAPVPVELTINRPEPVYLWITDTHYKNSRFNVHVDGVKVGATTDFMVDDTQYCGPDPAKCIAMGFSHGRFAIPPGHHRVKVSWVGKDYIPGTSEIDWNGVFFRQFVWRLESQNC